MGCGASNAGDQAATAQAQQEANTNAAVSQINTAFTGFNPAFYAKAGQAYTNYALPQLQQQYQTNANNLGFKLADQGLGKSSQGQQMNNALTQANTQNTQQLAQNALGQEQTLQQQVGTEQSNLIGQAQTASDPSAIGQQAMVNASSLSAPSTFQPIGNMFSNFSTQYLANQNASTYNPYTNLLLASSAGNGSNYLPSSMY